MSLDAFTTEAFRLVLYAEMERLRAALDDFETEAFRLALHAKLETLAKDPADLYYYASIFPGMNSSDFGELLPKLQDVPHRNYVSIPEHARRLRDAGESYYYIARLLGVDERTVKNWVKRS